MSRRAPEPIRQEVLDVIHRHDEEIAGLVREYRLRVHQLPDQKDHLLKAYKEAARIADARYETSLHQATGYKS